MTIDLRYGDAIEQMKLIPDKSIDMILCDPPYPDYYTKEFYLTYRNLIEIQICFDKRK